MAERKTAPATGGSTDPSIGGKYSMRLSMPGDDEVVRAFADAQGSRSLAPAVRQLIHMWVNEFGPVNVIDTITSSMTLPGLASITHGQTQEPTAPAATHPVSVPSEPVAQPAAREPKKVRLSPAAAPAADAQRFMAAAQSSAQPSTEPSAPAEQAVDQEEADDSEVVAATEAELSMDPNALFRGGM